MSLEKIQEVEKRFQEIKKETSADDWLNPDFLYRLVRNIEKEDTALAYRLIQRAHTLRPDGPKIKKKMHSLCYGLNQSDPNFLHMSSDEQFLKETAKGNISGIFGALRSKILRDKVKSPFTLFVILPSLIFFIYQVGFASERYESRSILIVKKADDSVVTPSFAMLPVSSLPGTEIDANLVKAYILSTDMYYLLDSQLALKEHYSSTKVDFFSRLHSWSSSEDLIEFYRRHLVVTIDRDSSLITIKTQGFTADFAKKLNQEIVRLSELYINNISNSIADQQLSFVNKEHLLISERLARAKSNVLEFQAANNILDPLVEAGGYQQITFNLESAISSKKVELYRLQKIMTDSSPLVTALKREIEALEKQLLQENARLTGKGRGGTEGQTVSTLQAKYYELKIELDMALQAFSASLVSLEKKRVDAYRQLKFLVVIESPTLTDENQYPEVIYNTALLVLLLLIVFGLVRVTIAIVDELN